VDKPCILRYDATSNLRLELPNSEVHIPTDPNKKDDDLKTVSIPNGENIRLECINQNDVFHDSSINDVTLLCKAGLLISEVRIFISYIILDKMITTLQISIQENRSEFSTNVPVQCVRRGKPPKAKFGDLVRNGTCENSFTNIDVHLTDPKSE
jgi:hypothetical protein